MKPFLVYQYLLRETDEEHFVSAQDIVEYLQENFGISAERRSIYRDIHEINKALLPTNEGISLEQAEEFLSEDEEYKIIRHHKRKGFKDRFFNVRVPVYVSELFFGWLAGFGKQVRLFQTPELRFGSLFLMKIVFLFSFISLISQCLDILRDLCYNDSVDYF